MNMKIHSLRFDADAKLLQFVESKVTKLGQFHDQIIDAEMTLKLDKADDTANKVAELKIVLPGGDLFSKKQAKSFEEATDLAIDALKKQITKTKEKQRGI